MMTEAKQNRGTPHESRNDMKRNSREDAPESKEEAMFVLFTPGNREGTRVTVRNIDQSTSAAEPIRKGAKPGMVFVQTDVTVPVGTVVTLAMPGAYDVKEQQAFEGAVSFICPAADQFGYSSGLGIRMTEGSQAQQKTVAPDL